MRVSFKILAITALFGNFVAKVAKGQTTSDNPIEISTHDPKKSLFPSEKATGPQNATAKKILLDNWMSRMGPMQNDLINVQAVIVKDEEMRGTCGPSTRKSNKRYLMCGGSILNRNHVLTSATCLHEATHIRHNIRAPLSVVIAPLKHSVQVIGVAEYQVHPRHNTNPYSSDHLKHNIAILKLACRISMDNYQKIDLPTAPMTQTCSEENCIVAVYRKTGRTSHVMFQILAPNIPYLIRRRKETSYKDVDLRRSRDEMIDGAIRLGRSKRRLAVRPVFVGKYKSGRRLDNASPNSTSETTTAPTIESISPESKNFTAQASLYDEVSKALRGSNFGNETIKSFVVRSSTGLRSCAQTGSPIMFNKTQAALVAIPCDDRQPSSRWFYSDIFGSLDWIHQSLQDWGSPGTPSVTPKPAGGAPGNFSGGCSTCIFNFFIEIGCKDKNQCGKNYTNAHLAHLPGQEPPKPQNPVAGGRRKNSGCSGTNSVGIEFGVGQGCEKTDKDGRLEYGGKSAKLADSGGKEKHLSLADNAADDVAQVEQPVTDNGVKTAARDYNVDKEKYSIKDNSRVSGVSQTYKTPIGAGNGRSNRERVSNEIGLQNIESDSADWVSEVEKGLDLSSQVKRELVKSPRPNVQ